jgi:hypothetical protein
MQTLLDEMLGQVRQEIGSICDSEGDRIQADEVERAITHLLQTHLEDCRFQYEIQEWLDNIRWRQSDDP